MIENIGRERYFILITIDNLKYVMNEVGHCTGSKSKNMSHKCSSYWCLVEEADYLRSAVLWIPSLPLSNVWLWTHFFLSLRIYLYTFKYNHIYIFQILRMLEFNISMVVQIAKWCWTVGSGKTERIWNFSIMVRNEYQVIFPSLAFPGEYLYTHFDPWAQSPWARLCIMAALFLLPSTPC